MPVVEVMPQSHREREVLAPALAAASDADSEPEMPPEESTARLRREARSFEHQLLHAKKNNQCEHCLRGRVLNKYKHSHRPGDDEPAEYKHPESFGRLTQADNIIVSAEHAGMGGEQNALLIRDHYSGVSIAYPQLDRSEESNYLSMKHFAGAALNGATDTVFKSDTAGELTNAAHRLCWTVDPSLTRAWPHNASCERDIRSLKEACRPSHLQAGFWKAVASVSGVHGKSSVVL